MGDGRTGADAFRPARAGQGGADRRGRLADVSIVNPTELWSEGHRMGRRTWTTVMVVAAVVGVLVSGCGQNELGRYTGYQPNMWVIKDPKRVRNLIVKSENYWIQKEVEPEEEFPGPTPEDLKPPEEDYILGPGDLIDITVFELMQPGQPYVTRQRISQTGQITFPYLGTIKCAGLTTRGLEEKIADLLEPDYLVDPQVTVFVTEYRNLNVSILNGVARPGIYPMTKQDMTLLELVAMAGGILQLTEDYGYVIRKYSPDEADLLMLEGAAAEEAPAAEGEEKAETGEKAGKKAETEAGKKGEGATGKGAGAPSAEPTQKEEKPAPAAGEAPAPPEGGAAPSPKPAEPSAAPKASAPGAVSSRPATSRSSAAGEGSEGLDPDEVRELLQQMAEGRMPELQAIESAEVLVPAHLPGPDAGTLAAAPVPVPADEEKELGRWIWSDGKWIQVKPKPEKTAPAEKPGEKPTEKPAEKPSEPTPPAPETQPVQVARPTPEPEAEVPGQPEARLALEQKLRRLGVVQGSGQLRRIIRFDVEALQAGDPTQNIVLRDGDIITIPSPPIGDFYMAGEVARPGVYSLTGRKITLLQAIAAAGGLTAVAVPWRTELVRRVSETEEEIIYVDLGKISRGEAPDFYIQPEDQIRVGTDQGAVFNAVLRNAFRATYGLGFVYDMNFADFYPWTDDVSPIFDTPF